MKWSEDALLSEEYINSLPGLFYVFDEQRQFVKWNKVWGEVTGYSDEELGEMYGPDFFEDPVKKMMEKQMMKVFREGAADAEADLVTKDGQRIPYYFTGLRREFNGKPHLVGLGLDITNLKLVEQTLRETQQFLHVTGRMAKVGGWKLDATTRKMSWTEEVYRIHEVPLNYQPPLDEAINFFHPDDRQRLTDAIEQALEHCDSFDMEMRFTTAKGKQLWTHAICKPLVKNGKTVKLCGTFQDITERKQAEEVAQKAQEELLDRQEREKELVEAELAKARGELVRNARLATIGQIAASIAHELRNPLGSVRNAAYYLKRHVPTENPRLQEYLDIIDQQINAANRVICDMMEMARSKEPVKKPVDLGSLLRDCWEQLYSGIIQCDISLKPGPFSINADAGQLQQVISNILLNAIQVMDGQGDVTIVAQQGEDYDTIKIQDTGPGITPEDCEHLFEPLFTTKAKGTGLGLAICRQIIERHDGTIELLEQEENGAAFCIRLPH